MRIGVLESRCLNGLGECDRAFKIARSVAEEGKKIPEYKTTVIDALLEMSDASQRLFQVDSIFEACEEAERLRQELPTDDMSLVESIRANILYHESMGLYYRDDVHQGIRCAHESLSTRERLADIEGIVSSLMRVGYLHIEVDPRRTLECQERALELNRQLGRKRHIIQALMNKSLVQIREGKRDEAEQLLTQGMSLISEHDMGYWLLPCQLCFALLYKGRGEFHRSVESFQECLRTSERVGAGLYTSISSFQLSEIYRAWGNLDDALRGYERAMVINKRVGRIKAYAECLGHCGLIEYAKGNSDEALLLLEEALAIAKERKDSGLLVDYIELGILYTVLVLVEKRQIKKARQRVEELRQIVERSGREVHNQVYLTTAAIVLSSSSLIRNRALAKEYLTEVVEGKLIWREISSMAYLLLCDILVEDLRLSGDKSVLDELKWRLKRFVEVAMEQGSTSLQTEGLLLQSKVALLELQTEKANRLLSQAKAIADEKGLVRMLKRIVDEHEVLLNEVSIWERLGESKPSLAERTGKVRIHEQIGEMIQMGMWRKMLF